MFINFKGQGRDVDINTNTISEIDYTPRVEINKEGGTLPAVKITVQRPLAPGMGEYSFNFIFNDVKERKTFQDNIEDAINSGSGYIGIPLPDIKAMETKSQ